VKLPRRIPDEISSAVALDRGERALAWTTDDQGRHIVATDRGLVLQRRPPAYDRIDWELIDQASYDDGVISLTLVPDGDGAVTHLRVPVGDAPELPIAVRDRVTASIVVNQHVPLEGRKGVRVVARRGSVNEELRWGYVPDSGLVLDDVLQARARELVDEVRAESGLG
jgi:hypothetical protein